MKIGDLVQYRGWKPDDEGPLGIVVDQRSADSDFHHRIRVMWVGEKLPIQAEVLSVRGARVTRWCQPGNFVVVSDE